MRLISHLSAERPIPAALRGGAVAIGNFDGVHLGHRAVIDAAAAYAARHSVPLVVLTFEPHPRLLFQPDLPPFRLTPLRTKLAHFDRLGVDAAQVLRFDRAFAQTSAEEFVQRYLVDGLGARYVAIGESFRFGHGRRGDAAFLRQHAAAAGCELGAVPPRLAPDGEPYASTRIREHLVEGRPERAAELLGRWYCIGGRVEHGDPCGRTIGFRTANVALGSFLRPLGGDYAVFAEIEGRRYRAIANLGLRPTFGGPADRLEVHIFDYSGGLDGKRLCVDLVAYLRPEKKFSRLEEVKAQIVADSETTHRLLAEASVFAP
jgi:riboflavin kinase/FMN adenylyltransferase